MSTVMMIQRTKNTNAPTATPIISATQIHTSSNISTTNYEKKSLDSATALILRHNADFQVVSVVCGSTVSVKKGK